MTRNIPGGHPMNRSSLGLFSLLVLSYAFYTFAGQRQAPGPAPAQQQNSDRFEDAHQGLFGANANTPEEKARLTNEVAKGLPDNAQAMARIPRKNFIDEFIFGKIER